MLSDEQVRCPRCDRYTDGVLGKRTRCHYESCQQTLPVIEGVRAEPPPPPHRQRTRGMSPQRTGDNSEGRAPTPVLTSNTEVERAVSAGGPATMCSLRRQFTVAMNVPDDKEQEIRNNIAQHSRPKDPIEKHTIVSLAAVLAVLEEERARDAREWLCSEPARLEEEEVEQVFEYAKRMAERSRELLQNSGLAANLLQ